MMKDAGCVIEIPSLSTVFTPPAAASRTTSTKLSSSRFTSSMYSMPLLAFPNRPGEKALLPDCSADSTSRVPQTLSSVAPRGSSTRGVFALRVFTSSPRCTASLTSLLISLGSVGLELNESPTTISISGSKSITARTTTDLPVPRSPITRRPPMRWSITFSRRPSFMSSCWTTRVKGNALLVAVVLLSPASATAFVVACAAGLELGRRVVVRCRNLPPLENNATTPLDLDLDRPPSARLPLIPPPQRLAPFTPFIASLRPSKQTTEAFRSSPGSPFAPPPLPSFGSPSPRQERERERGGGEQQLCSWVGER
mmetsp:Transcript_3647/g.10365  ORF Transcript_3647/g.10365 Transcript_3647/m.10365 type:complete len:311 (+) Transcript_3647:721-1653(+)